jgi:hypothetical protein
LLAALGVDAEVHEVVAGTAPLVPANNPGGTMFQSSATFMITTRGKADRLSFASMLICTNDGFTGLDGIKLSRKKTTVFSVAYDAGTGMTDPLLAEDGVVIPHVDITGDVDLHRKVHDWNDPVAKIVIERI